MEHLDEQFGFVLCGGGAKGAYQMGALQALEEDGLLRNPAGLSGVSIGALNALVLCCCGAEKGCSMWKEINPFTVFDIDLDLLDGRDGTFSRQGMRDLLHKHINFAKIRQAVYPIYVTVAPTEQTAEHQLNTAVYYRLNDKNDSDMMTLMEATSALPVIYEDVSYGGIRYRDGGLLDNMPIKPLYDNGCRRFIILALSQNAKVDTSLYPDAEFYLMKPYKDLGGILSGTLNFTKQEIAVNLKLGYKDAKRFCRAYLQGDESVAAHYDLFAEMDYNAVIADTRQEQLQAGIDEKLDYIANIIDKYDV